LKNEIVSAYKSAYCRIERGDLEIFFGSVNIQLRIYKS